MVFESYRKKGKQKTAFQGLLREYQRFFFFILAKKRRRKEKSYNLCGLPAVGRLCLFALVLFYSRKEEKSQREVIKPLRLCVFARVYSFFSQTRKACLRQAGLTFNDTKGLAFSIYSTPA